MPLEDKCHVQVSQRERDRERFVFPMKTKEEIYKVDTAKETKKLKIA